MSPIRSWSALLESLLQGHSLSEPEARALMEGWLAEEIPAVLTGALLAALRAKGVNGEELAAMAAVLRQACPLPGQRPDRFLVDTCGTGGDGADTFNISTAVAFTAAALGATVAKHGNRSASGRVGSADVLEALGLHLQARPLMSSPPCLRLVSPSCSPPAGIRPWWVWPPCAAPLVCARSSTCSGPW